jgi:RNA polymerase sigma-70 factor (ECF subfamily)
LCLRLARRIVRDPYGAEDVAQEALLRAWRHRASLRDAVSLEAWLARIVRNEAARRFRKQEPEPVEVLDTAIEDHELATLGLRLDIQAALGRLDDLDQRLLRLRYERDMTQAAIAKSLGLPEGTVKVRLHRARDKMYRAIKDE